MPQTGQNLRLTVPAQDDGLRGVRVLDGAQFCDQSFMDGHLVECDAARFGLRNSSGSEIAVTILGVVGQLLDNLSLADRGEIQPGELSANRLAPVRHVRPR